MTPVTHLSVVVGIHTTLFHTRQIRNFYKVFRSYLQPPRSCLPYPLIETLIDNKVGIQNGTIPEAEVREGPQGL
ncbi:hypothetical protein SIPHO067v1_p0096 [Vibrio phage 51E28.1]|nr:hypothetical protein SIPHO068v1_p0003 [Vibrio phage 51E28.4]QZI92936.1 hypothetical protein SIPHO067v1_p0096 [Vibrio phage 51E28.1]